MIDQDYDDYSNLYLAEEKSREWHPIPFDSMHWHSLIWRVSRGQGTYDDAMHIRHHLGLERVSSMVSVFGGDDSLASIIRANLQSIRERSLAKYGFSQRKKFA